MEEKKKNLTDFFVDFIMYSVDKYKKNTKYLTKIDELFEKTPYEYYGNINITEENDIVEFSDKKVMIPCDFLDSDKINDRIYCIIDTYLNDESNGKSKEDNQKIYDKIVKDINNLKIEQFLIRDEKGNKNTLARYMEHKIKKRLRIEKNTELKFEHLQTYYKFVIETYFNEGVRLFMENNFVDKSVVTEYIKSINAWQTRFNNIGYTDEFLTGNYPFSIFGDNKTHGIGLENGKLVIIKDLDIKFDDDSAYRLPNNRIFCSGLLNESNYVQYGFNRFTFYHEIGHNVINPKHGKEIKINKTVYKYADDNYENGKNVAVQKTVFEEIRNKLNKKLTSDDMMILINELKFQELYIQTKDKHENAVGDIMADLLATTLVVSDLKRNNISNEEIFKCMITVYEKLHGDNQHFGKKIRALLNIYISKELSTYYENLIKTDGETPRNEKLDFGEIVNLLKKIEDNALTQIEYEQIDDEEVDEYNKLITISNITKKYTNECLTGFYDKLKYYGNMIDGNRVISDRNKTKLNEFIQNLNNQKLDCNLLKEASNDEKKLIDEIVGLIKDINIETLKTMVFKKNKDEVCEIIKNYLKPNSNVETTLTKLFGYGDVSHKTLTDDDKLNLSIPLRETVAIQNKIKTILTKYKSVMNGIETIDNATEFRDVVLVNIRKNNIEVLKSFLKYFKENEVNDDNYDLYFKFFTEIGKDVSKQNITEHSEDLEKIKTFNKQRESANADLTPSNSNKLNDLLYKKYIKYKLKYMNLKNFNNVF